MRRWAASLSGFVFCSLMLLSGPSACRREQTGPPGTESKQPAARQVAANVEEEGPEGARQPEQEPAAPAPVIRARPGRAPDPAAGVAGAPRFEDVTVRAGITHRHRRPVVSEKVAHLEPWLASIGAAAAIADVEGDGDPDIYATTSRSSFPNALYLNQSEDSQSEDGGSGLRFVEAAREAGIADVNDEEGVSTDAVFADLDNDGDPDLYVACWGANRLYRNDGRGRFVEVTSQAGVGDRGNAAGAVVFDYDRDGLPDIYVCNYFPPVPLRSLESTRILPDDLEEARNGGPNVLYHNEGGLRFRNVAAGSGVAGSDWSLDAGIGDVDHDGDTDLFVANDFGPDRLLLNRADGTFLDVTEAWMGLARGRSTSCDFGDVDGDGLLDLHVAGVFEEKYFPEGSRLWRRAGGRFVDVAAWTGVREAGYGWCGRFLDYDLDGDLDLLVANGFLSSGATSYWEPWIRASRSPSFEPGDPSTWPPMGSQSLSGGEATCLFDNHGDGSFSECAEREGIGTRTDGRGIALADLDRDGDLDAVVASQDQVLRLYRSQASPAGHWLTVRLEGTRSTRDALGARVELTAEDLRLVREVNGVNGFASQSDLAVHFGLGPRERADTLRVTWPSGAVTDLQDLAADHHYWIREPSAGAETGGQPDGGAPDVVQSRGLPKSLLEAETALWLGPCDPRLANAYRELAREEDAHERSIRFFRDLCARGSPQEAPLEARLQLALAYIDRIPAVEKDVLLRASLAKESLLILDRILAEDSRCYPARFICGMNHLYWPASLKHAPDALRHLDVCRDALESPEPPDSPPPAEKPAAWAPRGDRSHRLELLLALGDARVKDGKIANAREIWRQALAEFPGEPRITERLSLDVEQLLELVRERRGLDKPIDTGLAFLETEFREVGRLRERRRREETAATATTQAELEAFERSLREEFSGTAANRYRTLARSGPDRERGVRFLESLLGAGEHAAPSEALRLQTVLALLDRLPDPRLGTFGKGRVAARAIELAESLAPEESRSVGLHVLVGSIYLHQSPDLGEVHLAIRCLRKAVTLTESESTTEARPSSGPLRPAGAYCALGDALVKAHRFIEGRKVWKQGLERWPEDAGLLERLGLTSLMVNDYVARTRSWEAGLDTDAFAYLLPLP